MATLDFHDARRCVVDRVGALRREPPREEVRIEQAAGRVLAEDIIADRDYPPAARSVRDGFAVRSSDLPGELRIAGEVRAGERYRGDLVAPGEAIEIMTGAPVPRGADAVLMVEHATREGDRIRTAERLGRNENIAPQGSDARDGEVLIERGTRLSYTEVALMATVGRTSAQVYKRPRVAILATGDEIIGINERPSYFQVRNSNAYSLSVQVRRAGGDPVLLPVARDDHESTSWLVQRGLVSDLLLMSGGVSAGKYDIVEEVLAIYEAEFFFNRVLIQPGQPLVFGMARDTFFFGLPGNPGSTMVTFELFAKAALELLSGQKRVDFAIPLAKLTRDFRHKGGLTRFLPARLEGDELTPIPWHGSSDIPAMARANAFLVAGADHPEYKAGDLIHVLPKYA